MARDTLLFGLALLLGCDPVAAEPVLRASPTPGVDEAPQEPSPPNVAAASVAAGEAKASGETKAPAAPAPPSKPKLPFGLAQLSDAQRDAMFAGGGDPIEPTRIHHVVSNESRHDLFFPYVRDRGGAYLGVASDANYTLIAVAKPEFAFLLDIDNAVVNTHRIYSVFVPLAETPDDLLAYFEEDARDSSLELLDAGLAEAPAVDRIRTRTTFKVVRRALYEHLQEIRTRSQAGQPTSWMSDPQAYAYVRRMFETDRIRMMPGDLGGAKAMKSVAEAVANLGTTINVVYESNAAEWFVFHRPYRHNMRALPVSPDAVLCRTIDTKPPRTHFGRTFVAGDQRWNYNVHAMSDYHEGLVNAYFNRNLMLKVAEREGLLVRETGTEGLSLIAVDVANPA